MSRAFGVRWALTALFVLLSIFFSTGAWYTCLPASKYIGMDLTSPMKEDVADCGCVSGLWRFAVLIIAVAAPLELVAWSHDRSPASLIGRAGQRVGNFMIRGLLAYVLSYVTGFILLALSGESSKSLLGSLARATSHGICSLFRR